jgi:hypothetical protein
VRLPTFNLGTPSTIPALVDALGRALKPLVQQVNAIGDGQLTASNNAAVSFPTGTAIPYAVGDYVKNSTPAELGSAGSKYIVLGWVCVTAGAPGVWRQCRVLTGN